MKNPRNVAQKLSPVLLAALTAAFWICSTAAAGPAHALSATRASAVRAKSADASGLAPDKGAFRILVSGKQVGKEQFDISPDGANWIVRGTTEIHSGKSTTTVSGTLTVRADGTPVRYEWSTQGAKKASATVDFNGAVASTVLHAGGARPFTQQFTFPSSRIAVLDNNLYDQYAILADLYDWNKRGAQTFPVLVPQELTPGSATLESMGQQDFHGKQLDELRVTTQDNEIDLYLDHSRLIAISVPSANAEIVRQ